jgi:putative DNA primase/helicase
MTHQHATRSFLHFLQRIIPEIKVRKFLQRLAGYLLTGLTSEHCFLSFFGKGRNGKSTFVETLLYVLGTYSRTGNGDTFLSGRRTGTVRDDLHTLPGALLVKAVETGKNARLDEATVMEHTGGDTVNTRALYGQQTEWKPNHKLILVSNETIVAPDRFCATVIMPNGARGIEREFGRRP